MEEILQWLNAIYPQSKKCQARLRKIIKFKEIKKGEYLLEAGEVCTNLYFIKKGLLKAFYFVNEKKVVDWFFWEGEVVVAIGSFYDQTRSEDFIQAMEDCELYYITYDELQHLYKTFITFNFIGRVLTTKYYLIWHRLARSLKKKTAAERYEEILKHHPELLQRVPLKDLAPYLNMTPETLSRMRSRIR